MRVMIIGGSGVTGIEVISQLLNCEQLTELIAVNRTESNIQHPKYREKLIPQMTEESLMAIDFKADHYICCLGSTIKKAGSRENFKFVDHHLVVAFGKKAIKDQAKSFHVISAMGSDSKSMFFYNRVKGEMEASLKALGLNSLYIYRPSLLVSKRKEFRPAEKVAISALRLMSPLLSTKTKKKIGTEVTGLATAVVNNVLSDEQVQLKIIKAIDF